MPKVGLTMTEGTITEWHKREGDAVRKGELLFTFETEKPTLEFESPCEGVLRRILVPTGQLTPCLAPVASVATAGDAAAPATEAGRTAEAPVPPETTTTVPEPATPAAPAMGTSTAGRPISPRARLRARERGVNLGAVAGSGPEGTILERDVLAYAGAEMTDRQAAVGTANPATPVAQRAAAELGVDLTSVRGSGPDGRITREDVERAAHETHPTRAAPSPTGEERDDELQPLSAARRVTARRTAASARSAPHVTLTTEADATELVSARGQLNAELGEQAPGVRSPGEKVSYDALLVAIVARALHEHPQLNASWDEIAGEGGVRLHRAIHVGVAVDTPRGLYVPVVRDATRPLVKLHHDLTDLVARALAGTLGTDEMAGGTFTLTNLGMYEIDAFTPIINPPQAAVLGVGRIVGKPVARGEQVVVRQMVALSLSFDHRVVDGAPAARFLQRVKQLIERPFALLV